MLSVETPSQATTKIAPGQSNKTNVVVIETTQSTNTTISDLKQMKSLQQTSNVLTVVVYTIVIAPAFPKHVKRRSETTAKY